MTSHVSGNGWQSGENKSHLNPEQSSCPSRPDFYFLFRSRYRYLWCDGIKKWCASFDPFRYLLAPGRGLWGPSCSSSSSWNWADYKIPLDLVLCLTSPIIWEKAGPASHILSQKTIRGMTLYWKGASLHWISRCCVTKEWTMEVEGLLGKVFWNLYDKPFVPFYLLQQVMNSIQLEQQFKVVFFLFLLKCQERGK